MIFDEIQEDQALEMAEFCRGRVPLLKDCIEAGRLWEREGLRGAWEHLRDSVEFSEEEEA